ncbi:hypothetical protein BTS2_2015 [Bacillus sp. TS-2]|nr:hypothetical protein BTS2_2015 [Bacillus sp. TS-2]
MSKDVIIHDHRVQEAKAAATKLKSSIDTTYNQSKTLLYYVQSSSWKGSARDSFVTYLEIIIQYHQDLKETAALQTKALNNIEKHKNDFQNDATVREVKNLW